MPPRAEKMKKILAVALIGCALLLYIVKPPPGMVTASGRVLLWDDKPIVKKGEYFYIHDGRRLEVNGEPVVAVYPRGTPPRERLGVRVTLLPVRCGLKTMALRDGREVFYFVEGKKLVTSDFKEVTADGEKIEIHTKFSITGEFAIVVVGFIIISAFSLISIEAAGVVGLIFIITAFGFREVSPYIFRDSLLFALFFPAVSIIRESRTAIYYMSSIVLPILNPYNLLIFELFDVNLYNWIASIVPVTGIGIISYSILSKKLNINENLDVIKESQRVLAFVFVLIAGVFIGFGVATALVLFILLLTKRTKLNLHPQAPFYASLMAMSLTAKTSGFGYYLGQRISELSYSLPLKESASLLLILIILSTLLANLTHRGISIALLLPACQTLSSAFGVILGSALVLPKRRDIAAIVYAITGVVAVVYLSL